MKNKIRNLDGLRVYWAVIIILSHFCNVYGTLFRIPAFLLRGHYAAEGFFVLSGFLLYRIHGTDYSDGSPIRRGLSLFTRNFRRFFPVSFVTMIPFAVQVILQGGWTLKYTVIALMNVLMVQNWIPGKDFSMNGVAWFLSSLMFIYLFTPFLFRVITRQGKKISPAVRIPVLVLTACGVLSAGQFFPLLYKEPLYALLGPFLLGVTLADLVTSAKWEPHTKELWPLAATVLLTGYLFTPPMFTLLYDAVVSAAVILLLSLSREAAPFSGAVLRRLSAGSFHTLMLHYPLCALLFGSWLGKGTHTFTAALTVLTALVLLSFALGTAWQAAEQAVRLRSKTG